MEYKLEIYAPESEVISIRDTLNKSGAGVVGDYDSVISIVQISGFWRPTSKATPVTGEVNKINFGNEVRIDVRCKKNLVSNVIKEVKKIHPYEEPVINVIQLSNHEFE